MTKKPNQQIVGNQDKWEALPFGYFNLCSPLFRDRCGQWSRWEAVGEDGYFYLFLIDGFSNDRVFDRPHLITASFDRLVSDAASWSDAIWAYRGAA